MIFRRNFVAENEKKNSRTRRTPSLEKAGKQADQPLSGAVDAPGSARFPDRKGNRRKKPPKSLKKSSLRSRTPVPSEEGRQRRIRRKRSRKSRRPERVAPRKASKSLRVARAGSSGASAASIGTAPIAAAQQAQVIKQAAEAAARPGSRQSGAGAQGRKNRRNPPSRPVLRLNEIGKTSPCTNVRMTW